MELKLRESTLRTQLTCEAITLLECHVTFVIGHKMVMVHFYQLILNSSLVSRLPPPPPVRGNFTARTGGSQGTRLEVIHNFVTESKMYSLCWEHCSRNEKEYTVKSALVVT